MALGRGSGRAGEPRVHTLSMVPGSREGIAYGEGEERRRARSGFARNERVLGVAGRSPSRPQQVGCVAWGGALCLPRECRIEPERALYVEGQRCPQRLAGYLSQARVAKRRNPSLVLIQALGNSINGAASGFFTASNAEFFTGIGASRTDTAGISTVGYPSRHH